MPLHTSPPADGTSQPAALAEAATGATPAGGAAHPARLSAAMPRRDLLPLPSPHAAGSPAGCAAGTPRELPQKQRPGDSSAGPPADGRVAAHACATVLLKPATARQTRPLARRRTAKGRAARPLRTTWGRQRHGRGNRGPRPPLHVMRMGRQSLHLAVRHRTKWHKSAARFRLN